MIVRTVSKIAFWIVVLSVALFAITASFPRTWDVQDRQSYVGCMNGEYGKIECSNFALSEPVEIVFDVASMFVVGNIFSLYTLFSDTRSATDIKGVPLKAYVLIIIIIDILAVTYVVSLIRRLLPNNKNLEKSALDNSASKNIFQKLFVSKESNGWEYTTAKILIIILLVAATGRMAVLYVTDPEGVRTPLAVSATIGKAPFTVNITGPEHLLVLKDTPYIVAVDDPYRENSWVDESGGCGFSVNWYKVEGASSMSVPRDKEQSCAESLSHTFTEPGRYRVNAGTYDYDSSNDVYKYTWNSKSIDILVE